MIVLLLVLLSLSGVTVGSPELHSGPTPPLFTNNRRAKMPDFKDKDVANHYAQGSQKSLVKLPPSVNNLKVKVDESKIGGRNVAMNINIPSSISGYLLEEIDLKYVKENKKRSKSNEVSKLLIKYFTNKNANLHLSSVTKDKEVRPSYYPSGDLKYRRDEYTGQNKLSDYDNEEDNRPFLYTHKYPLRLLEKIKSATERRKKLRKGKTMHGFNDATNSLDQEGELDIQVEGGSLDEIDMKELEGFAIKPINKGFQQVEETSSINEDEELSIPELYSIFQQVETAPDVEELKENKKSFMPASAGNEHTKKSKSNWFSSLMPNIFSILPQPLKSSLFSGKGKLYRNKRSTDILDKLAKTYILDKSSEVNTGLSHFSQYMPPKTYSDPRKWSQKKQLKWNSFQSHRPGSGSNKDKSSSQSSSVSFDDVSQYVSNQASINDITDSIKFSGEMLQALNRKKLSKIDYYFAHIKVKDDSCKQRILCEIALEPSVFEPLSGMLRHETSFSGDMRAFGRELLETEQGARLLSYIEATRRGEQGPRGCEVYKYRCPTSARDAVDTNSLAIWREISSWLTVKLLAANTNGL